ncbi:MAG TPA: 16S rRNA (cytosine(967)-C(5))-methyltransferase RsmB [Blastocatellia bacterium]|nr:16S rRNA (cytosine(967)-C(5))-methyltransferase RsmB [Blastocatellia bacterium]
MNSERDKELVSPARSAAFDILRRVESEHAFASVLIARLDEAGLSREDRALAQEIVLGVLRWRRSLDYLVERYSKRSIDRLDLPVLISLRMGIYQLRHLSRVPQSAAVNESVNLVKRARTRSASGLVNAVLRNAARLSEELPGEEVTDALERASIELSHPRWMLERWGAWLGEDETRALALANNTAAVIAFRVNTLRSTVARVLDHLAVAGVTVRESELSPGAFVVTGGPASAIAQAAERGLIYVQDEASQLISVLLEPQSGHRVLDLCAAPGSKSSHIATLTDDQAWIVACDVHPHRLATLRATCERLGITSIDPVAVDATKTLPLDAALRFDRVLVDSPCSGTGTLRGNPEIKWRLSPADITNLAELQLNILQNAASAVATGGRVLYSTCSLEREENEDVVLNFLAECESFRVIHPNARADLITVDGFVRTFPHRHASDGFFSAVLEKIAR